MKHPFSTLAITAIVTSILFHPQSGLAGTTGTSPPDGTISGCAEYSDIPQNPDDLVSCAVWVGCITGNQKIYLDPAYTNTVDEVTKPECDSEYQACNAQWNGQPCSDWTGP
jgi:hypothetical protein